MTAKRKTVKKAKKVVGKSEVKEPVKEVKAFIDNKELESKGQITTNKRVNFLNIKTKGQ